MQPSAAPYPTFASRTAPGGPPPGADPWRELEDVVDRLARLVLHAHSLAERTACLPAPLDRPDPARTDRVLRLRAGADLGARALQAAVRVDLPAVAGGHLRRLPPDTPDLS